MGRSLDLFTIKTEICEKCGGKYFITISDFIHPDKVNEVALENEAASKCENHKSRKEKRFAVKNIAIGQVYALDDVFYPTLLLLENISQDNSTLLFNVVRNGYGTEFGIDQWVGFPTERKFYSLTLEEHKKFNEPSSFTKEQVVLAIEKIKENMDITCGIGLQSNVDKAKGMSIAIDILEKQLNINQYFK